MFIECITSNRVKKISVYPGFVSAYPDPTIRLERLSQLVVSYLLWINTALNNREKQTARMDAAMEMSIWQYVLEIFVERQLLGVTPRRKVSANGRSRQ